MILGITSAILLMALSVAIAGAILNAFLYTIGRVLAKEGASPKPQPAAGHAPAFFKYSQKYLGRSGWSKRAA